METVRDRERKGGKQFLRKKAGNGHGTRVTVVSHVQMMRSLLPQKRISDGKPEKRRCSGSRETTRGSLPRSRQQCTPTGEFCLLVLREEEEGQSKGRKLTMGRESTAKVWGPLQLQRRLLQHDGCLDAARGASA